MANRKSVFTQADVTRACKGVREAGFPVARVEISRDGKVIVYTVTDTTGEQSNDWDRQ